MSEPEEPKTDWRKQVADIAKPLSAVELIGDFRKLYAESMQPLWESIRDSSDTVRRAVTVQIPHDLLNEWTERQTALTVSLQGKFQTPACQDFFKYLADWQTRAIQPPAYQHLFAQIAESQKAWSEGILSQIGPAFAQFQSTALHKSWTELGKVFAEAIQRTHDALERVELLAALGWTLPMEMSLPEFHGLVMQDNLTVESVDEWFLAYYSQDEGMEFKRLKDHLLESDHLVFWKTLMEQVFDAFGRDQFAVCVPSLLCILEGSIAVPWEVTAFHKERCRKEFFEGKVAAAPLDSIHQFQWKSLAAFVQTVFEGVDPNQEYPIPKRNLILHGKSDPTKWDRADCLRLFQAIDIILSLGDELNTTQLEKIGRTENSSTE